jgi:Myosin N-terminal SH3-like domain
MPPPRLSHNAEAARAAALQAEFNEKKWVWVPDDKDGYLAGWVVKEDGDLGEVVMAAGGDVCRHSTALVHRLTFQPSFSDHKIAISCSVEDEPSKV